MRVFVYEWVTGGGLVDHTGPLPASLLREGLAMARGVARDFAALPGAQVTMLRELRVDQLVVPGAEYVDVGSRGDHDAAFDALCERADATLLIAPETDGVLAGAAHRAAGAGARLVSPDARFIALTGDKHATCERLAVEGVPVPRGVLLGPDDPLPRGFDYPAVLKPYDGAGSQDTWVVRGPDDAPPAYAWPRRLEPYTPGLAASVAVLCGPAGAHPLPACMQRLSADGRLSYLGGRSPLAPGLAQRAEGLALRALAALPPARGWVGVDLVLGDTPDGSADLVIEVNPRLTTSYVGLRARARESLAAAMLAAVAGETPRLGFDPRQVEFDAAGSVFYPDGGAAA